ncbi:MAG: TolC family protein [Acidobacteriaceae bacterium]|nr:TolC family protein [Acidobacteriaceae bacterium]
MRTRLAVATFAFALKAVAGTAGPVHMQDKFIEQEQASGTTSAATVEKWWATLSDPELNSLIERAVRSNLDLKLAGERLLEARAARRIARAALLPSIDSTESFDRIRGGFENGNIHVGNAPGSGIFVSPFETNLFQIGLDASWELDFFGGRRHELAAATADVAGEEESRRDVQVSLLGEVATNYAEFRGAQKRLAITNENIQLQRESLDLTKVRSEAGLGTELDVERQREQLESSRAIVPQLQAELKIRTHALSVLLGRTPDELESELAQTATAPVNPPQVPVGLPADLLARRPDVRRATAAISAAAQRVGAAKADLFPKIVISGAAGRQATDLSGFTLGAGNFFSVGPGITVPIFEGGRIRANIAARKQQLAEAQTQYEAAVLTALRETEDALTQYGREQSRREMLASAVDASRRATELASELYTRGLTDFLSVLDAQREQLASEDALVQSDTAIVTDLVSVYKSLGGGWGEGQKKL